MRYVRKILKKKNKYSHLKSKSHKEFEKYKQNFQLQESDHSSYEKKIKALKSLTKLKIKYGLDYMQMIIDNDLKSNEKDILSKIYDLSIKLFNVMKYYPDMKDKNINYHEIF